MAQIRSVDTTDQILREIGARLRGYRLQQNVTIAELADRAGIGIATAARAETGHNTSAETIVKMLRALGRLDALDAMLPEPLVSPIQLAARRGRQRQRARPRQVPPPGQGDFGRSHMERTDMQRTDMERRHR
jgi:transcriptional regulator with XRE-family HTH domain